MENPVTLDVPRWWCAAELRDHDDVLLRINHLAESGHRRGGVVVPDSVEDLRLAKCLLGVGLRDVVANEPDDDVVGIVVEELTRVSQRSCEFGCPIFAVDVTEVNVAEIWINLDVGLKFFRFCLLFIRILIILINGVHCKLGDAVSDDSICASDVDGCGNAVVGLHEKSAHSEIQLRGDAFGLFVEQPARISSS
ncbi:unannotated protein [freshwater metagenome]|uniref:Unannotated protein n=1 Tax=freshwater metagenome TaxID=449393 RepID=A0A6J6EZC4_9ZZZZ